MLDAGCRQLAPGGSRRLPKHVTYRSLQLFDICTNLGPQNMMRLLERNQSCPDFGQICRTCVDAAVRRLVTTLTVSPWQKSKCADSECADRSKQYGGYWPVHGYVEG